ncbi:MAG: hypothetical protein PVF45_13405 [Anaerolineae bacterium]|jgi:hypothetical protein
MDFDRNADITTKYGAFTLAYSQLLNRLSEFKRVLSPGAGPTQEQICAGVDNVVGKLLREGQPRSLVEAAQHLGAGLRYERELKANRLSELAPVYDALSDAIQTAAPAWDYRQDVTYWHHLGRRLARRFYAASPHGATRYRLAQEAGLRFEWTRRATQAPFGYREDRLRAARTSPAGVITVRFSFSEAQADNFINYLAYPFYFMHEYVSHVYTVSGESNMFTDGWLLLAAHRFLRRLNAQSDEPFLQAEQIDALDALLPQSGLSRAGYALARRFQAWADAITPGCFDELTYHLTALASVNDSSHTRFLWSLDRELNQARSRLRERLESGGCQPQALLLDLDTPVS